MATRHTPLPSQAMAQPDRHHRCAVAIVLIVVAILSPRVAEGQAVGHISAVYTDSSRGDRIVPVEIYYPAQTAGDGVPVATGDPGGYPVLAFGHAYKTHWWAYQYLWEALAPAGYIVVFPLTEMTWLADHEAFAEDLRFVIDRLRQEGQTATSLFAGRVVGTAALMGHSLGGGASVLAAADDPTISAVAIMAALETTPSAIRAARQVTAPALVFCGSYDCITPPADHQLPIYDGLQSSYKTQVTIAGGSHCQFAEPDTACDSAENGCPIPLVSRQRQQDLTRQLLLPWLDCILKERPNGCAALQDLLGTLGDISFEQHGQPPALIHVGDGGRQRPDRMHVQIGSVQPNPFQSSTEIRFHVLGSAPVSVHLYDLQGRRIRTLLQRATGSGWHTRIWDGRDDGGRAVSSGIYMCRLESGGHRSWGKILLLR